jgi:tetratricopeptide (TPR) repeat protein
MIAIALMLALQQPQYRSAARVEYFAQPATGGVAHAESLSAADPRNVDLLIELGKQQAAIRQYREAIQTFTRGIRIAPDNPLLYRWRGHRYISIREFDRAIADLVNGNSRDTTNYAIWYHLGVAHYLRGEFDSAAVAFAHAKPRAPPEEPAERMGSYDWLWMSLMRAGRPAEAAASIADLTDEELIRSGIPYAERLRLYRGFTDAEHALGPGDSTDVNIATVSYGVGNWYLLRGDTTNARRWFQRSVASGGWPAFGFIASEVDLRRVGAARSGRP